MSLSDVIRNITKTITDKKAKDLPLLVVQGTLSAAGHALGLVDRMKKSIKGPDAKEEKKDEHETTTVAEVATTAEEEKPARREPVIFAPRPGAAEPNGTAKTKPDPVIFSPAKPAAEPAAKTEVEPESGTSPVKASPAVAESAPSVPAEPTAAPEPPAATSAPVTAPEPPVASTEPVVAPEPAAAAKPAVTEPVTTEPQPVAEAKPKAAKARAAKPRAAAKARAAKPRAAAKPKAVLEGDKLAEAVEAVPAAEGDAAQVAPSAVTGLAEPLPGYSELTVASLRARMRGKSAEQISAFLAFEQVTKARPEVVRMYENRLAKLQAGE